MSRKIYISQKKKVYITGVSKTNSFKTEENGSMRCIKFNLLENCKVHILHGEKLLI